MNKKILLALMMVTLGIGMVGCGASKNNDANNKSQKEAEKKEEKDDEKYVGFVTDVGSIDDKSFNPSALA